MYKSPVGVNAVSTKMSTYKQASVASKTFRNANAYPRQIAAAKRYDLAFVACSGATIVEILNGKGGNAPQINTLSSATRLVTLTAGGNDAGFSDILLCTITSNCTQQPCCRQPTPGQTRHPTWHYQIKNANPAIVIVRCFIFAKNLLQ